MKQRQMHKFAEPDPAQAKNRRRLARVLRSGRYQQTTQRLAITDRNGRHRYCCLGVAVHEFLPGGEWLPYRGNRVVGPNAPDKNLVWALVHDKYQTSRGNEFRSDTTPPEVWMWAKFGFTKPDVSRLMTANDGGMTFAQVADAIEAGEIPVYE